MTTLPQALAGRRGVAELPAPAEPQTPPRAPAPARSLARLRWVLAVYGASRLLYLLIAAVDTRIYHWTLGWEFSNWDGFWYLFVARTWYPPHVLHFESTLGFLPLYPMVMWAVGHGFSWSLPLAGIIVSLVCGFVATVLVGRLAEGWWDASAARRVVIFLCFFPGSIVFSMVYTEGLLLALVAGCLLALERRRWVLAGVLAALATATAPVALAIVPACLAVALREGHRAGWRGLRTLRPLLAPALAPLGLIAFGLYLWSWTGSPFASYVAQRYGWAERSTPLALYYIAHHFASELLQIHSLSHPAINLNWPVGLLGGAFLVVALVALWRARLQVSLGALVWTAGCAVLTLTSANTPPNPRMLLVAFPALAVVAYRLTGRAFTWLIASSTLLLVAMSIVTFVGTGLRP